MSPDKYDQAHIKNPLQYREMAKKKTSIKNSGNLSSRLPVK